MKRLLALFALFALLALALAVPAGALAGEKSGSKTKAKTTTYKGSFRAVGADGAYTDKRFGKAQLQDHRKKDKLKVHVRRLAPRTTYSFALYSAPKGTPVCEQGAAGGTQESAFAPKSKKSNSAGNFNSNQRSKTFKADATKRYFVLVSTAAGEPVACAALSAKKAKKGKGHGKAKVQGKAKARGK